MKRNPIIYSQVYENNAGHEGAEEGFKAFKNNKGEYVFRRIVTLQPKEWMRGVYLYFTINEEYSTPTYEEKRGKEIFLLGGENRTRKITDYTIYDYQSDPKIITLTIEQRLLTIALAEDLRGNYANQIARQLYVDCFVLNKQSPLKEFLPDVYNFHLKLKNDYSITTKT